MYPELRIVEMPSSFLIMVRISEWNSGALSDETRSGIPKIHITWRSRASAIVCAFLFRIGTAIGNWLNGQSTVRRYLFSAAVSSSGPTKSKCYSRNGDVSRGMVLESPWAK